MLRAQVAARDNRINLIFLPGLARDFRIGSIATEMGCPRKVRLSPDSDRRADIAALPKSADSVEKVFFG
jgi:hypothetical protein